MKNKRYVIDYGFGIARFYTPYEPELRFYTLAGTCFGIRKSIIRFVIKSVEEVDIPDFERLEFGFSSFNSGDVYVWNEKGERKMLSPILEEEWDDCYVEDLKFGRNLT